ncbi:hypothetical protein ACFSLT_22425 [Novosphingobium resinovorum]
MLAYLGRNWTVFVPFYGGFAMLVMMTYSINAWGATYLMRRFAMIPAEVGQWQGSVGMVLGTLGALLAGVIVDGVSRHGHPGGKFLYLFAVSAMLFPATLMVFMPTPATAIMTLGLVSFFMPMIGTGMVTGVQELVPGNMRGICVSLFGLFNTITGQTLGPYLVAAVRGRCGGRPCAGPRSDADLPARADLRGLALPRGLLRLSCAAARHPISTGDRPCVSIVNWRSRSVRWRRRAGCSPLTATARPVRPPKSSVSSGPRKWPFTRGAAKAWWTSTLTMPRPISSPGRPVRPRRSASTSCARASRRCAGATRK